MGTLKYFWGFLPLCWKHCFIELNDFGLWPKCTSVSSADASVSYRREPTVSAWAGFWRTFCSLALFFLARLTFTWSFKCFCRLELFFFFKSWIDLTLQIPSAVEVSIVTTIVTTHSQMTSQMPVAFPVLASACSAPQLPGPSADSMHYTRGYCHVIVALSNAFTILQGLKLLNIVLIVCLIYHLSCSKCSATFSNLIKSFKVDFFLMSI